MESLSAPYCWRYLFPGESEVGGMAPSSLISKMREAILEPKGA